MAYVYTLTDGTTTLTLTDNTNYNIPHGGFSAPAPAKRIARGGRSFFADGSLITRSVYDNRFIGIALQIKGSTVATRKANIQALNALLERAREYTEHELGSQVTLTRLWDSSSNTEIFNVLNGTLNIGRSELGPTAVIPPTANRLLEGVELTLECEPFILGTQETIRNYVANPGFEMAGTALADWTENKTGSGTTARDTTAQKHGDASLKLVMTSSSSGQVIERNQALADVDAAEVWSFQCWVRVDALSNCKVVMEIDYNTGTDVEVSTTTVDASQFVKLTSNNNTVPGSVTSATLRVRLEATDASATGVCYIDSVIAVQAAAVPTAWVSGAVIGNHMDDNGQAHINYLDIYDIPGDVMAPAQIKLTEGQNHSEHWDGVRHAGRMTDVIFIEGETATATTITTPTNTTITNSTGSSATNGDSGASSQRSVITQASSTPTVAVDTYIRNAYTIASPPRGQYRVLIRAGARINVASGAPTVDDFRFGLSYTYGAITLLDDTNPVVTSFKELTTSFGTGGSFPADSEILDLGIITIPPIKTPDNMAEASLVLKIFMDLKTAVTFGSSEFIQWFIDYIMLMPIDFGGDYVSKTSGTDIILLDSLSTPQSLALIDASDVIQSIPSGVRSSPPKIHPDGSRLWFLTQDGSLSTIADGWTISLTYQPLFLETHDA